ncbi:acid-sensing ion channel 4-B-like [Ptychodera flava]|uniref:acid-sensing ion channel 4-B-like n=1 Tax=Ptychodera flava TaxID=63121 RepID=UPI00396A5D49
MGEFNTDPWSSLPGYVQENGLHPKRDVFTVSGNHGKRAGAETHVVERKCEKFKKDLKVKRDLTLSMLRARIDEYANDTTLHGLKYAVNSKYGAFRRTVWALVVAVMVAIFTASMVNAFMEFQKREVSTVIKINYVSDLDFPAVTICNYNQFRKSVVNESGEEFLKLAFPIYGPVNVSGIDWDGEFNESRNYNMTEAAIHSAHQLEQMLIHCNWKGSEICGPEDFTQSMTDFGVCYTFNDIVPPRKVQQSGTSSGLFLRLNVEQEEYTSNENTGAGFRVMAHPQGQSPLVKLLGFAISPGYETLVAMSHTKTESKPYPYPSNCSSRPLKYYQKYTRPLCMMECITDEVVERCGCRKYTLPGTARSCGPEEWLTCVEPLLKNITATGQNCDCPTPCEQAVYDTKVSAAYWPSEYVMQQIQEQYNITDAMTYVRKNFLDVWFYFEELSFTEIQQVQAYTSASLQSDIGGFLGLFLGASLITVMEFIDFIILNCIKKYNIITQK